jgi:transcriptional regulator with XRE-family HTH domain
MSTFDPRSADSLQSQLREAIRSSRMTRYRIAKLTRLSESSISRFMAGKGGLSIDSLDRIWSVLGLRVAGGPQEPRRGNSLS